MVQGRWGHKAVYVEATKSVYIVGGEISGDGLQITNEVLQLDLTQDSSTPTSLPSTSLSPLAFHSLTYSPPTNELITFGGLTSSCSEDSILHSYSLETQTWRSENANGLIRRRGAGMVFNGREGGMAAGGEEGGLMVFGGIADQYSCSAITYAYPAFDILPIPLSSSPTFQTERMTINGGIQGFAVSDFGMASLPNNTVLFLGGSDKDGNMVEMDTLTGWSSERDWYQLELGGEVPEARVGGGMTVHPTLSDLVIFQGGATKDGDTSTPVPTLNFLNLTTLEWFTPTNLQPPASYARAWHGSTMTSSGVIVTSFGLGSTGTPRDDITFLDLSNPDASKWSWKSVWSSSMLTAPEGTSSGSITASTGLQTDSNNNGSSSNDDKELKSILPPVLIVGIILLGLGMWLARRQVGIVRRRRLARHFEIDATHDEDGNRRGSTTNVPNPLAQFLASRGWKRQSSFAGMGAAGSSSGALPRPFGGIKIPEADAASVKSAAAAIKGKVTGILKRWSGGERGEGDRSREMTQTGGQGAARVQWEEIDFGLGRLDEQRRGPIHGGRAPVSSSQAGPVRQIAKGQFGKNHNRVSYDGDLADAQELPEVVVVPPSNPVTPMPALNSDGSEMNSFPILAPSPKIDDPETTRREAASKARASAEWDDFARDVQTRNPFADPEPVYADDGEENNSLPPLAFQRTSVTDFSTGLSGYGIGLGQPSRRVSTPDGSVSRSVSSPHSNARASVYSNGSTRDLMTGSPTRSQDLTRSVSDRTRNLANMFTRSSVDSSIPDDANITPLRNSSRQRLSNPPLGPPPTSPLPNAPNSAFNGRRVSAGALPGTMPADGTVLRTASGDRHLHIANPSFDSEVDEFGSSNSHGHAL